ncbi:hypothetical protein [Aureispira anguillae]|uniref:Helix-turn-helix domain-containing protein n=1 Tax=Aureispira anguillae TaxID=2864201 RepID=A0A915YCL6_9BACT|nr:hypothetical protein [Aureispira anguillae]BDS10605.1 hypothetical protein AsAng_0013130 [Aureispira anguillae]BDS10890.1 hypothetical protein AsAng_0016000 [Aureispira anguillae]
MNEVEELKAELRKEIEEYRAAKKVFYKLIACIKILSKIKITSQEAAILLGVKSRTIRKYNQDRKLLGQKYTKTGKIFFRLEQVMAYRDDNLKDADSFD